MTKQNKYQINSNSTVEVDGRILKQILSLIDIPATDNDGPIPAHVPGGYIEDESNLSQEGNCWIAVSTYLYNNTKVSGDARLTGSLKVANSTISGSTHINSDYKNRLIEDSSITDSIIEDIEITKSVINSSKLKFNAAREDSKISNSQCINVILNNPHEIIASISNSNIIDFNITPTNIKKINIENVQSLSGICNVAGKFELPELSYIDINNVEKVHFDPAYLGFPVIITSKHYVQTADTGTSKYVLNYEDTIEENGINLYRVEAITDFGNVLAGDLGGFVPSLKTIRQDDESWVDYEAKVVSNTVRIGTQIDELSINSLSRLLDKSIIVGDVFVCLGNGDNHRLEGNSIISNIKIDEPNKYSLTEETIDLEGIKLYRIKAEKSFSNVTIGDLGGYVETEANLSQQGNSWLYNAAKVFNTARVEGDAIITDNVEISAPVVISNSGSITGNIKISASE